MPAAALAYELEEVLAPLLVDADPLDVAAPHDHAIEDVLRELVKVPEDVAPGGRLAESRAPSRRGPQRAQVVHGRPARRASRHEEVGDDGREQRDRGPAPEAPVEPADQEERGERPALRRARPCARGGSSPRPPAARLRRSSGARASMPTVSRV